MPKCSHKRSPKKRSPKKRSPKKRSPKRSHRKFYGMIGDKCPLGSSIEDRNFGDNVASNIVQLVSLGNAIDVSKEPCYKNCGMSYMTDGLMCKPLAGNLFGGKEYMRERVLRDSEKAELIQILRNRILERRIQLEERDRILRVGLQDLAISKETKKRLERDLEVPLSSQELINQLKQEMKRHELKHKKEDKEPLHQLERELPELA